MRWQEFAEAAPELAGLGEDLIRRKGVCLLGTLRKDGSPRISPCEAFFVDGDLLLGMMWQSKKALDLLRDPQLVVHSATSDREGTEGDFKLYGRAVDVQDPSVRERYAETLQEAIDWRPTEPYHLFAVDIRQAGYIKFGEGRRALRWDPERGPGEVPHPDA
jgi:pyridoxamine 5'-phosphate oxidase-like protein